MKLYLLNRVYFEKQADVPKGQGKFEIVEFPFNASPKADFVSWMNQQEQLKLVDEIREELIAEEQIESLGTGSPEAAQEMVVELVPLPPPPASTITRADFDEAWFGFPLPLQCHYAALAMEECRAKLS